MVNFKFKNWNVLNFFLLFSFFMFNGFFVCFKSLDLSFFVFNLFQINLIFSSCMVIFSLNPVYSVLFLVLVFLNGAGLLFFLNVDFLAFMLVIVYVGAIAVLFLFIVMMLNLRISKFLLSSYHYFLASFISLFFFVYMFISLLFYGRQGGVLTNFYFYLNWEWVLLFKTNLQLFGLLVYGPYFIPLFVSFLILLIAVMGAVSLTYLANFKVRKQAVYTQLFKSFSVAITTND